MTAPIVVAHAGGSGHAPANTFGAYRRAHSAYPGVWMELDAQFAADGELMAIHDDTLDLGDRAAGCLVVFVRCHYDRERYLSEAFLEQAARRYRGLYVDIDVCVAGTWGAEFAGGLAPAERDVVVSKHRFSAFEGTDLDLVLRTHGIRTLVVTGVVTHVCVESTVRDAFFRDYGSVVVDDAVAGWQPEWHRTSRAVMGRGVAEVVPSARLLRAWQAADRRELSG